MAVIVAPQPQAAEIGLEVLRRGGNAVDAAVTCAFAQGVLDPQMCGIGGCGVMLVHDRHGEDALLEFYATAGSLVRENLWEKPFLREAADRYGHVPHGAGNDVSYQVNVSEPLRGTYRGLSVVAAGAPAGGLTLMQMLNYLEGFDIRAAGWPSTVAARRLVDAMGWAVADREEHLADPRFVEVPTGRLADKADGAAAGRAHSRSDTTDVCVVDDEGGAVSLTHTLGSASGVVTRGLGFGYNDYMNCFDPRPGRPNSIRAGKTRMTMMTPTMVVDGDKLRMCGGAPGGTKIVTGILQTIVNVLDHGMTPVETVTTPRG